MTPDPLHTALRDTPETVVSRDHDVERWIPPGLAPLLDCVRDDLHPDQIRALLHEAFDAGCKHGRPFVGISPGMRSGQPTVNHTRLSVEAITEYVWAGDGLDWLAGEYDVTRPDILVACWYRGTYGSRKWRQRWGPWAEQVHGELWHHRYDIPDPPSTNDTESA